MEAFIARQPIFDRDGHVFGYELLFRSSMENVFRGSTSDHASSKVIADSISLWELQTLVYGNKAFVNMTRKALLQGLYTLLPRELAVFEIPADLTSDVAVVDAARKLKDAGYLLAIDDVSSDQIARPTVKLADFVKVDFLARVRQERAEIAGKLSGESARLIASKVESDRAAREAMKLGFDYVQGFFFSKPVVVKHKDIPSFKLDFLALLREIHRAEMNFNRIETILKRNIAFSYKLLRFVNSPFFGWRGKISSITHALTLLGENELRKWASVVALCSMVEARTEELITATVARARFCELLAPRVGLASKKDELFLVGMFSMIDVILEQPMAEILKTLPLVDEISAALLGKPNRLRSVLDCAVTYGEGDWTAFSEHAASLGLDEATVPTVYLEAVDSAQQSLAEVRKPDTQEA